MKKYFKHFLVTISILININLTKAQENQISPNEFKFEDSLKVQLQKHGLDMYTLPALDPCFRLGKPPLLRDLPFQPIDFNPVDSFIADTTLRLGPTRLGKTAGDVNIFWLHGLNGSTESWAVAAKATEYGVVKDNQIVFKARKANSYRGLASNSIQLYSENLGILSATQDVEDYMKNEILIANRTSKDFIIGHSQGGIVGREWLRQSEINTSTFDNIPHGLVTFGTSHDGAEILNNSRPDLRNKVPDFMNEACKSLGGAYVIPKINSNFATQLLISNDMQQKLIGLSCGLLANSIIPFALDNYYKRTTLDYYNGSPYLTGYNTPNGHVQGLSEYTLKVPVVQFYGIEREKTFWKFMSSVLGIGQDKLHYKEATFGYDKDDQLELKVNDMINQFDALSNYEQDMAEHYGKQERLFYSLSIFGGATLIPAVIATTNKNASIENYRSYEKAKIWLTNANEYYLTDIVGARVAKTTLNCRVVGNIDCRDNRYNPIGSGVPPVNVSIDYNFNTTNSFCNLQPVSIAYSNYHFTGHNGLSCNGPCTGNLTVIPAITTTYWYKDNDGVVLAESAKKEIKVDKTNPDNTQTFVELPETNHDQMKNSTITKKELNRLYNGIYGPFFAIPVR